MNAQSVKVKGQGDVECEKLGKLGIATLNRPQALNALSLEMFQVLRQQILTWSRDPSVSLIVIRGAGEKAFCAGGDVKNLVLNLREHSGTSYAYDFFLQEYSLDYLIHTCCKPILVIAHGLTFGGGIGLLAGGTVRLVTSNSVLAMPEVSIGYFTDVGASYFLNRMPGKAGLFCALTAAQMSASDAIYLGLADLALEQDQVAGLLERLSMGRLPERLDRAGLLDELKKYGARDALLLPPSRFEQRQAEIDRLCQGSSVVEIEQNFKKLEAGEKSGFPWSLQPFFAGSPTSVALIFELLKRAKKLSLRECFDLELNLALEFCRRTEFIEGVRALLIDKDKKPRWNPSRILEVDPREIETYFAGRLKIEIES